ncbi:unnamed protein product [Hydatigera taeniaeformis]|uniref:Tubulin_C domain-containing protein n=1 Tax=Hydatigena taeniaeformis TaxID=6205 RepID=A0A0R3WTV2_HYDTA|nr:unnamed protein product [Hydatigera taeniaeformis]
MRNGLIHDMCGGCLWKDTALAAMCVAAALANVRKYGFLNVGTSMVQDTVIQLQRFVSAMATYHENCYEVMKGATIFPLEMDLSRDAFAYKSEIINTGEIDDDEVISNDNDVDVEALADLVSAESNLVDVGLSEDVDKLLDLEDSAQMPKPRGEQKDVFDLISMD